MVVGWCGKDHRSDLQLMKLIWVDDELEFIRYEKYLKVHFHHLREVVELARGSEGGWRRIHLVARC